MNVDIMDAFPSTKSFVKLVQFENNQGIAETAVLKLYDRTCPGRIRKFIDPSMSAEQAFLGFVRTGKMRELVPEMEITWKNTLNTQEAVDYFDYEPQQAVKYFTMSKFEARVWYEFYHRHKTELRAYKQLNSMQGREIPRLYANVRIPLSVVHPGAGKATPDEEEFLCVPGLLLQYSACNKLNDLQLPWQNPTASEQAHRDWSALTERAVNAMDQINEFGVILKNYSNNVMFKNANGVLEPYIIDFAQAALKEDLVDYLIRERNMEATDFPPQQREIMYWNKAKDYGNPASVDQAFSDHDGLHMPCQLPDYEARIKEIRQQGQSRKSQNS
ncbi:kinase-like domain-containing protein [Fusarium mexicanum]|uniref:Kinase-like domain-containing protein n=1 Tax=Fusarium mexicanum TaxID=751941 RepID=A0A8H5IL90_9HYPO|nr:kinase-like domain-containing protein [Fusarium mexicanum]